VLWIVQNERRWLVTRRVVTHTHVHGCCARDTTVDRSLWTRPMLSTEITWSRHKICRGFNRWP
jgi:hypothetical protein